jgi:hypothetical protein
VHPHSDKKPLGFHLLAIDRFMRSSHAVITLVLVAAASIVALLLSESGTSSTRPDFQRIIATHWRFIALFAVIFSIGGWPSNTAPLNVLPLNGCKGVWIPQSGTGAVEQCVSESAP